MLTASRLLGLAGILLVLGACTNRLDTPEIEAEIKADIERQGRRISLKAVRCPDNVPRQAGAYFRCVGELKPEGEFGINVTQQDEQGNVTWDVPSSEVILNMVKVEAELQEQLAEEFSRRAIVNCDEAYRINQPGERFECDVVGGLAVGQGQIDSLLVRINPEGDLEWYEQRSAVVPVPSEEAPETSGAAQPTAAAPSSATATNGATGTETAGTEAATDSKPPAKPSRDN